MTRAICVLAIASAVALGVAACGDSGPVAGELRVSLTTPNASGDGALLLTLKGPAVPTSATAGAGLRVFHLSPFGGDSTRFAVTGTLQAGVILRFGVPDVRRAGHYSARIDEVAAATSHQLRPTLTGYSLQITK